MGKKLYVVCDGRESIIYEQPPTVGFSTQDEPEWSYVDPDPDERS